MSYETDFMDAMCENLRQLNDARQQQQETVVTIASSMFVRRLMTLYRGSGYQSFEQWLHENYSQLVPAFSGQENEKTDRHLNFVFNMAKRSQDSRQMLTLMAKRVNDQLRERGYTYGFNEVNFYFIEKI